MLCCTFWNTRDDEEELVFLQRHEELTKPEGLWGGMIARGAKSHTGSLGRREVITMIYGLLNKPKIVLNIQREIVDEGKAFQDTSAIALLMDIRVEAERLVARC